MRDYTRQQRKKRPSLSINIGQVVREQPRGKIHINEQPNPKSKDFSTRNDLFLFSYGERDKYLGIPFSFHTKGSA